MIPLLVLVVVLLIGGGVNGKPPSRITGGAFAKPGDFKYLVVVMESGRHICGGAIISKRHILTAGHCIESPRDLSIASGIIDLNDPNRQVHKVSTWVLHPEYIPYTPTSNVEKDIGIVVLAEELTLNEHLTKVLLPFYQIKPGFSAVIGGWGYTSSENTETSVLMKMHVTILNEETCNAKQMMYTDDRLCGYNTIGTICGGDSGSPLVAGQYVVGLASASRCTVGEAHTYANVYYYVDWIRQVMRQT